MFWGTIIPKCNLDPNSSKHFQVSAVEILQLGSQSFKEPRAPVKSASLVSFSGTEVQLGPVRQQALPGPGEDREEQQEGGPDQSPDTRLERRHGARRGLL